MLGILGSGQLARMLALSAHPLGLDVRVFATHANDPAALVNARTQIGSLSDETDLKKFLSATTYVTFESEFLDIPKLSASLPSQAHVFPKISTLQTIQDRLTQKRLLDRFKIPTSPWLPVEDRQDLLRAAEHFPHGFVLKQRRFGYDGYGTFVFRNGLKSKDFEVLRKSAFGFIAEAWVPFKRELALSFVRSRSGGFLNLPLVESVQRDSRCFSVRGPLPEAPVLRLKKMFKNLMQELEYEGVLAVELFDCKNQILVNELAPRVHNSAHYSIDALTCSQFEYHLRAGLDLELPKVELIRPGFAMVNLLGEGHKEIRLSRAAVGKLHWYGKSENRAGRKLGHITVLDRSSSAALQRALKWRKEFQL